MATFGELVQDRVGTFSNTDLLDHALTAAGRIVIDHLFMKYGENNFRLELYYTDKTDSDGSTGIAVTGGRVIGAHKSGYKATKIDYKDKALFSLATSIYNAVATSPVYYLEKTKGYVLPGGGTLNWVAYPTVGNGDSAISNFPPEGYPVVVLYASIQAQMAIIQTLVATTMSGITWAAVTDVATVPSAPAFTWTDAVIGTYTATTLGTTATVPTYTKPTQTFDMTQFETFLETSKDVELAQAQLGRLKNEIEEYQLDIQNELNEFNKEMAAYQGVIQQEIEQARLTQNQILKLAEDTTELNKFNELKTLEEQIAEYQGDLGKYQGDIQDYSAKVNEEAQRVNSLVSQYSSMVQPYLSVLESLRQEYTTLLETL